MITRCPNCKTDVGPAGEYVEQVAGKDCLIDDPDRMKEGEKYVFPKDVECPECGALLRYTVPLFAVNVPHWRIIRRATK